MTGRFIPATFLARAWRGLLAMAALGAAGLPQGAAARDFETTIPTLPLHYRYAACVFGRDAADVDSQIASCARLRAQLEAAAEPVLENFHNTATAPERRQFLQSLDLLELEAREIWDDGRTVPPVVLTYVDCMGRSVMESASYRDGIAVDFEPVYRSCRESTGIRDAAQDDRRTNSLLHRFELRRRYIDTKAPGSRWATLDWTYGFFDRRRLPAAGEVQGI